MDNLTHSLTFNAYRYQLIPRLADVDNTHVDSAYLEHTERWFVTMQEAFSATNLSHLVKQLSAKLGTQVLNLSAIPYKPYGASTALLMGQPTSAQQYQLAHLDKSHIAAHSYFSQHRFNIGQYTGLAQCRLEVEIASCGDVHPVETVALLLAETEADFAQLDFRIRGMNWSSKMEMVLSEVPLELKARLHKQTMDLANYDMLMEQDSVHLGIYIELLKTNLPAALNKCLWLTNRQFFTQS